MQQAIGNETRFRLVKDLVNEGTQSATDLRDTLNLESNTLYFYLDTFVDIGLVENGKRKEPTSDGF